MYNAFEILDSFAMLPESARCAHGSWAVLTTSTNFVQIDGKIFRRRPQWLWTFPRCCVLRLEEQLDTFSIRGSTKKFLKIVMTQAKHHKKLFFSWGGSLIKENTCLNLQTYVGNNRFQTAVPNAP